jgi:LmbE family N-acetylglucosaminyl deacetylase
MKVLTAFAHPDDETMLIGGTLAMLSARGARLHILSATRGEGGELGEPPLAQRSELGEVREGELRCAVDKLGADTLIVLGYLDPTIEVGQEGRAFTSDPQTLLAQIRSQIQRIKPDVVITHGSNGEYGHPAHILIHQAVFAAAKEESVSLYGISAYFMDHPRPRLANQDDPADFLLDIGKWFYQKLAAAQCHRTQQALFVRRSSQEAGKPLGLQDVLMRVESLHRFLPPSGNNTPDPLSRFLQSKCSDAIIDVNKDSNPGA